MTWTNLESMVEEGLWDLLKEEEELEVLSSADTSVIPHTTMDDTETRVVYVKKRKYEKRQDDYDQSTYPVLKRKRGAPAFYVSLPRILKNDIRRKYMLMYENVMNSFNYHLITSFFEQFFVPNVTFEKKAPANLPACEVFVEGVKPVSSFFLLALQLSPDKTTRVFDVQLKQSSADVGKTEVSCRFTSRNTKMYELNHRTFIQALKSDLQGVLANCLSTRKIRKTGDCLKIEDMDDHQLLFDPISGIFLKSKFARAETLVEYEIEGSMSFIVNEEKRIERIIGRPIARAVLH